ncbi:M60 family metallopeptidase [Anaeromicropila populeti]|uniref:Peptidase M60, enhancin and enhancin-like n=1 Tax=Anaeromicropila populeti TaxID=37658 RepID=A0A1I6LL24_9FIRM|nr:M60 family metallopeptidase [Anaeromicropila populeti]SFS03962.1 Peptidase M60, enhancin and enhancin-like [Anaeromicropila populeti]
MNFRNMLFNKVLAVLGTCCLLTTSSVPALAQGLDTNEIKDLSQNEISLAPAHTCTYAATLETTPTNISFEINLDNWRSELQKITASSSSVSAAGGTTGRISVFGNQAFPIAVDAEGCAVIAASKYGNGRIVVAAAPDYVSLTDLSPSSASAQNLVLKQNIYKWLTESSIQNTQSGYTNSYSEALSQDKMMKVLSKSALSPASDSKIENVVVTAFTEENLDPNIYPVVYLSSDITDDEAALIDSYVQNGGSIVTGERGWVLECYPDNAIKDLKNGDPVYVYDYPFDRLISQMGVGFMGIYEYAAPNTNNSFDLVYSWNAQNYQIVNLSYDTYMLQNIENGIKSKSEILLPQNFSSYTDFQKLTQLVNRVRYCDKFLDSTNYFAQALLNNAKVVWNTISFPISIIDKPYTAVMAAMSGFVDISKYNEKAPEIESFMGDIPTNVSALTNVPFNVKYIYQDNSYLRSSTSGMTFDWQSTGLYAVPGQKLTIDVPDGVTNLKVRIGSTIDKLSFDIKETETQFNQYLRYPVISFEKTLKPGSNDFYTPFGGLVYIIAPTSENAPDVQVTISGAIKAPRFVLGETTESEWNSMLNNPAPMAELQSNHIILTMPTKFIANSLTYSNAQTLMQSYDQMAHSYFDLAGLSEGGATPNKAPVGQFRYVKDVQISYGYMYAGYPIMYYDDAQINDFLNPNKLGGWGAWHELGHNFQMDAFTGSYLTEVTENIYSVMMDLILMNNNQAESFYTQNVACLYTNGTLNNYFYNSTIPYQEGSVFLELIMFDQLRQKFGFRIFRDMMIEARNAPESSLPTTNEERFDYIVVTASKVTGCNLIPFFDKWRVPISANARNTVNGNTQYQQVGDFTYIVGDNSFEM